MPNRMRPLTPLLILLLLAAMTACSDDPATPGETTELEIELVSPIQDDPEAAFAVHVEANLELTRVVFQVDGVEAAVDSTAPFEFLWNVALYADGDFHYLLATGHADGGRTDSDGLGLRIPAGVRGVLVSPPPGGGLGDPESAPLSWLRDPLAAAYEVAVSLDPDLADPTHTVTTSDTTVTVPAAARQWQYWRVRARPTGGVWGPWSETGVFYGGRVFERDIVYGGSNSSQGLGIAATADGGYLVAGSYGYSPLIRRLDPLGNPLWSYEPYFEGRYHDIAALDDGGCVAVGVADHDLVLTRLAADGTEVWSRPHFGSQGFDYGQCVRPCANGGFVAAGTRDGQAWLLRASEDGHLIWERTYGSTRAAAVLERPDGGFVVTGDYYGQSTFLLGTDADGLVQWRTDLAGGDLPFSQPGVDLVESDGGYTVLDVDGWLYRFDLDGQYLWEVGLGGYADYRALATAAGGGYVAISETDILRLDAAGQELWRLAPDAGVYAVCRAGDDGHAICGDRRQPTTQRHLWVLRINDDGEHAPPPVD